MCRPPTLAALIIFLSHTLRNTFASYYLCVFHEGEADLKCKCGRLFLPQMSVCYRSSRIWALLVPLAMVLFLIGYFPALTSEDWLKLVNWSEKTLGCFSGLTRGFIYIPQQTEESEAKTDASGVRDRFWNHRKVPVPKPELMRPLEGFEDIEVSIIYDALFCYIH